MIIDYQIKSFEGLFSDCNCINSYISFNRNNINDMSDIFYGYLSLKELNLSNFNTDNITNIEECFLILHH